MDSEATSGQAWGDWIQGIGTTIIKGYADAKVYLPFQTQQLEINKFGQSGYYSEGQRGASASGATIAGVPTLLLLLIGAAVLLLKA